MNFISAFEVIGPNMVGPSSSHTAGAVKIGRVCHLDLQPMICGSGMHFPGQRRWG